MNRATKVLASVLTVGLVGAVGGWSTYAAFSSTTTSSGNSFAAGTVLVDDSSTGSYLYDVSDAKPGTSVSKCVNVVYSGSLAADVRLYASSVAAVGQYVSLTITPGSSEDAFPDCTNFVADGAAIYTGTLKGFADTHSTYETGLADYPGSTTSWVADDSVVYRFTLTMQDDNAANGGSTALSTGAHTLTWGARNK